MIALSCYQDVNRDGTVDTNLLGPDVVFTWLDKPSATFTLGGYSSIWTLRGGGDAICRAELDAYGWKGGKESTRGSRKHRKLGRRRLATCPPNDAREGRPGLRRALPVSPLALGVFNQTGTHPRTYGRPGRELSYCRPKCQE